MSRQQPFPRGLPPRPDISRAPGREQYRSYDDRNDRNDRDYYNDRDYRDNRNDRSDRDDYRSRSDDYRRPRSPPPPIYEFRGDSRYDSQSTYDDRRYPQRYEDRAPGTSSYESRPDTYRPRDEPSSFTFRQDAPPSIDFRNADNYRRSPPRQRARYDDNRNNFAARRGRGGGYRGRGGPRLASEREFLKGNRAPTPELMAGMDEDVGVVKYKPLEDLSDSDEADMDVSEDDNTEAQPKKKLARIEEKAADGDSVPKWSNPDPYTALPPPDESLRKKKDMVKLIRKARVTGGDGTSKPDTAADDFISFNFDDDKEESDEYEPAVAHIPVAQPARYSKAASLSSRITTAGNNAQPVTTGSMNDSRQPILEQSSGALSNNVPLIGQPDTKNLNGSQNGTNGRLPVTIDLTNSSSPISRKPPPAKSSYVMQDSSSDVLGSRKRNFKDEIKPAPRLHDSMKGKRPAVNGTIVRQWQASHASHASPWINIDHSDTVNMGFWLHKEIMDFYHFVKPLEFEQKIRDKLIEDLNGRVAHQFPGAEIRSFGSFPAGLYLPTADMDVVMLSKAFRLNGSTIYGRNSIRKIEAFLRNSDMVLSGSLEIILGAKVPLVKYVDKLTGLKVDISFENNTGLVANDTFQQYKKLYPAMPMIVTVIKHFLAMRGLNEPVNGGIGGFSVICLVVSLLQQMPQVQSKNMVPEHNLGEVLMEFFNLYGNEFNSVTTGISINPPSYFSKAHANVPYKGEKNKFMIIDPNNSSNDIAGGSSNTKTIVKCFADAYKKLQQRMAELQHSPERRNQSILECILGGNYSSFKLQRDHLAHIHERLIGDVSTNYA